jgi:hypothetical protein
MEHELITKVQLDGLSPDNKEAFVEAEAICRANVALAVRNDPTERGDFGDEMRLQYIHTIYHLAQEFGIEGLPWPDLSNLPTTHAYQEFARNVQAVVAGIIVRNRRGTRASSVKLTPKTRARIEQQIANLRRAIDESNLSQSRKRSLHGKLDQFTSELSEQNRLRLGPTMAVLLRVFAEIGSSVCGIAEAPTALTTIMHLIGQDKVAEEAETLRLTAPPKALPAPPKACELVCQIADGPDASTPSWDSDEIPF